MAQHCEAAPKEIILEKSATFPTAEPLAYIK